MGFLDDIKADVLENSIQIEIGKTKYRVIETPKNQWLDIFKEAGEMVDISESTRPATDAERQEFLEEIGAGAGSVARNQILGDNELKTKGDIDRITEQLKLTSMLTILQCVKKDNLDPVYSNDEEKKEFLDAISASAPTQRKIQEAIAELGSMSEKKMPQNETQEPQLESVSAKN